MFFNTTFTSIWFQTLWCINASAEHESSTQVVLKSTFWYFHGVTREVLAILFGQKVHCRPIDTYR